AYLAEHPTYGDLWNMIHDEFQRTKKYILLLSGEKELMGDKPIDQLSIQMRQRIELPLVTIQQHALTRIREIDDTKNDSALKNIYEKLVMRCSFGIINAERNSA
ncbi:MAG TPA: phosphoenolpyruvate carboxylase, partial [Cytophagaceae bacterium]|nr:phosphoenolpyruvate carboxylase [Cytophagaceae bacterium]